MAYVPYVAPTDTKVGPSNITTQNLVPAGTATAASAVEIACANKGAVTIQVTGTYTGVLSIQGTVDGSAWVTISIVSRMKNVNADTYVATIASAAVGIFQLNAAGFFKIRVTALAAVTGTAVVTINASAVGSMVSLDSALPAGAAALGTVAITAGAAVIGAVTQSSTWTVGITGSSVITPVPLAAQGASTTHHLISAATTNATSVKGSAGVVNMIQVSNINAAARYLKLYNKATAPTVGTDTPVMTILIPVNSNVIIPGGPFGMRFSTGIAYALTSGITVADTGVVAVSEHSVSLWYT